MISYYETRLNCASLRTWLFPWLEVLGVSTDELARKKNGAVDEAASVELVRRMEQIESLPTYQQRAL